MTWSIHSGHRMLASTMKFQLASEGLLKKKKKMKTALNTINQSINQSINHFFVIQNGPVAFVLNKLFYCVVYKMDLMHKY